MTKAWSEWTPLQKWVMGVISTVLGGVFSSLIIIAILDRNDILRKQIDTAWQIEQATWRIEQLENIDFPNEFPPGKTQQKLAIMTLQLTTIERQLKELKNALREHHHYNSYSPGDAPP